MRTPRCSKCRLSPYYCMCGGYNPKTNKYESNIPKELLEEEIRTEDTTSKISPWSKDSSGE